MTNSVWPANNTAKSNVWIWGVTRFNNNSWNVASDSVVALSPRVYKHSDRQHCGANSSVAEPYYLLRIEFAIVLRYERCLQTDICHPPPLVRDWRLSHPLVRAEWGDAPPNQGYVWRNNTDEVLSTLRLNLDLIVRIRKLDFSLYI